MTAEQAWKERPDLHSSFEGFDQFAVAFTMGKCEGAKTIYEIYESVFGEERVPPKQSNIAAQFDTPDAINGAARNIAKVLYG